MSDLQTLRQKLLSLNGKGYGAYKSIQGEYEAGWFKLFIDYVQADPYAPPSRVRVRVAQRFSAFPRGLYTDEPGRIALQDYVARSIYRLLENVGEASGRGGTGKSGMLAVDRCGQEVLDRTAVLVKDEFIEARLSVGLPARGRTIMGREAAELLTDKIAGLAQSLLYKNLKQEDLKRHVGLVRDQECLRGLLAEKGLIAFVGNGSILPRESGISERPLKGAVPFFSPPGLEVEFELPHLGRVAGMGMPQGVTLIVGGGYHGKSTLLRAIERGVYNHIPGDGRELTITVGNAVKIKSEDGRRVEKVNISDFIDNLPYGQNTRCFSTENASGSTSQAANIIEALECGTSLLLIDEDTSATNFMIRDGRMQRLVTKRHEPITPFIDRVRDLFTGMNVSTIIVAGGAGDYLKVADLVIKMQEFRASDVTLAAREIIKTTPDYRVVESSGPLQAKAARIPLPVRGEGEDRARAKARGLAQITIGKDEINLLFVDQLVDPSQTRAVAEIIRYCYVRYVDGKRTLMDMVDAVIADIEREGLDVISPFVRGTHPGDLAMPRRYEIAAAFNRLRSVGMAQ